MAYNHFKYLKADGSQGTPEDYVSKEELTGVYTVNRKIDGESVQYIIKQSSHIGNTLRGYVKNISPFLEIVSVDGVSKLVLRAGATVYIPDGFETDGTTRKFEEFTLTEDVYSSQLTSTNGYSRLWVCYNKTNNILDVHQGHTWSQDSAPDLSTSTTGYWYDLSTNYIKRCSNSTVLTTYLSFPIAFSKHDGTNYTEITQVFDWCGFISGTVFVYPNTRVAIANGRTDGKSNNIIIKSDNVRISTNENNHLTNSTNYIRFYETYIGDGGLTYDNETNYCYASSTITQENRRSATIIGSFTANGTEITSLKPRVVGEPFNYYILKAPTIVNYEYYAFKTYTNGVWGEEIYYTKNDIPNVGDEILDKSFESIGTITEVGNQKITLNDGTILYRYFDEDIKQIPLLHKILSNTLDGDIVIADDRLTSISPATFADMNLTSIDLSGCNNLTSIGDYCFHECPNLKSIILPSSLETIGNYCFSYCFNLETITINKPTDSISGAPWDAPNATIIWNG